MNLHALPHKAHFKLNMQDYLTVYAARDYTAKVSIKATSQLIKYRGIFIQRLQ